ncbi:MAG: hypothetical protein M3362_27910, partial [Acidobacteriota bacterium]|nr:hypothetical protein [Acidobacteriota bacterium]
MSTAGEVVGIVVFYIEGGQNVNFALPINYLRGMLDSVDPQKPIATYNKVPERRIDFSKVPDRDLSIDLTGRWKSNYGYDFVIRDDGEQVKIVNLECGACTFDARWEGDIV